MGEPEKRSAPPSAAARKVARMMLLERTAGFVGGQQVLARAIGIEERSLRAKFTADRGVSDHDLDMAVLATEARIAELQGHIRKLREVIGHDG